MNSIIHGNRSSKENRFREAEEKMKLGSFDKPDLFLLPEIFLINDVPGAWTDPANMEMEGNETYQRLGAAARSYNAYIAAPLLTNTDGIVHNSTVIFDREGEPVFKYNKTFPTPGEIENGVTPGTRTPECFDADFGRVGVAICYDLNFQQLEALLQGAPPEWFEITIHHHLAAAGWQFHVLLPIGKIAYPGLDFLVLHFAEADTRRQYQ